MDKLVQSQPGMWFFLKKIVSSNIWPQPPLNWGLFKFRPFVFCTPKSWDPQITVNFDLCDFWGMQRGHLAFTPLQQLLSLNLFRRFFKHLIIIILISFLIRCAPCFYLIINGLRLHDSRFSATVLTLGLNIWPIIYIVTHWIYLIKFLWE